MALNASQMVDEIVTAQQNAGKLNGLTSVEINALKADMVITYAAILNHIVANMEIRNVTVSTAALLSAPTPLTPVPNDGGSTVSGQMVGNADNQTLTQNNNGTGKVL